MTKSAYLDDKKYTEIAPAGIVKQMKDHGIISERVPYDTIYIDVYGAGRKTSSYFFCNFNY